MTISADDKDDTVLWQPVAVNSFLIPFLTRPRIARFVKYSVYTALLINGGFYLTDDYLALQAALPDNAVWTDVLQRFATSVDTLAWLGLVFLFELETYALPDEAFKGWVPRALLAARVICYVFIAYAAYGYTAETLDNLDVRQIPAIANACQLADQGVFLQIDTVAYIEVTSADCAELSTDTAFYQIADDVSVIDASTLKHVQAMGWVDVINAGVWIVVVLLIELEVWLQAADRFSSRILAIARRTKAGLYLALILNGVIWAFTQYWLYAWDSFLWLFGFWAIELNLAEWQQDRVRELKSKLAATR